MSWQYSDYDDPAYPPAEQRRRNALHQREIRDAIAADVAGEGFSQTHGSLTALLERVASDGHRLRVGGITGASGFVKTRRGGLR